MPKFELQKVGFVNDADNTENVVVSTILEGAPSATRSFVEEEAEEYVTEDNQAIKDSQIYTFTMAGKPTASTQLETWANAGTKVSISGLAYGEALLMDNAYLTFREQPNERRVWTIGARKSGGVGYNSDGKLDTETMLSANLLNMHYWQEGSTATIASGWSKTGGTTAWDSVNEEQDFSTTGATVVYLQRDLYFPFEKQVTFYLTVDAITSTTGLSAQIQALDENGSAIGTTSSQALTATGLRSVSRTLPSGTVTVRLRVAIGQNDSISFSNPGLSIGTSTTYISQ